MNHVTYFVCSNTIYTYISALRQKPVFGCHSAIITYIRPTMGKSIFDEANKVKGNWMKWEKVGDSIEGTLISIRKVHNALYDKDQTVYELKKEDGEVWNVGSKPAIDTQMKYVKLGQIVGFQFVEQKKPARPGVSGAKIIQVFANPKIVDEQWLKEQEDVAAVTKAEATEETTLPFDSEESEDDKFNRELNSTLTKEEKLERITELASKKLGATSPDEVKLKAMEATGVAFIDSNLDDILLSLENHA